MFITDVDLELWNETVIDRGSAWSVIILTEAICLYRSNPTKDQQGYRISVDLMFDHRWLQEDLIEVERNLASGGTISPKEVKSFTKGIIKSAFDLVMERDRSYTRDLALCDERFVAHCPDQARVAQTTLDAVMDPSKWV